MFTRNTVYFSISPLQKKKKEKKGEESILKEKINSKGG